ncbi:hypothetical protein HZ989_02570 [Brevundimonas sp. AJA228-03]|uniref:hypothetical protein n=1 Tax=Brevundimonas sp. AJA228-03 TaxID=2752515 RepID=UPI001AE09D4A|nr:hypothetical protein [Brevundimonas sp. AJA228-03]QTN19985.1 hypothetical protein HZ989_02570 [Brevundimonas sp. AJA228-03]
MRFPEPVRMSDDHASPVWARTKRRSGGGGGGFVGLLVTLLALFGVLTAVLGIKEQSLARGGALMDGWITAGVTSARGLVGQAPEAAESAADKAGAAAEKTGDALQAGAATTAKELKTQ